jgi:O-Antigen ligase/Tetratricopeptide repeat
VSPETPERSSSEASRDSSQRIKPTTRATDTASTATQYKSLSNMGVQGRRYRLGRLPAPLLTLLEGSPALPAALSAVGTFVALGTSEGGYYPVAWYAAGLFLLALLVLAVAVLGLPHLSRASLVGLLLFGGYTAWSYLSIAWSGQNGVAFEGAGRSVVYLLALALFVLWPFDARGARMVLGAFGLGLAAVGCVELIRVNAASQPLSFFDDIRFSEPVGYMNGNVAMWTMGMLACLSTAASREAWTPLRGLALGGAGVLGALSLMGQSRGWALALPVGLMAFVALGPGRPRKLASVVAVAVGCALAAAPVLALRDDFTAGRFDAQLADAVRAVVIMGLALALAGTAAALLDRRLPPRPRPSLRARRLVSSAAAAIAGLLVAGAFVVGGAGGRVSDAWDSFKSGEAHAEEGASRFSSAGTNRYDIWRVAWSVFEDHPLGGVGADSFQAEYLRRGKSDEQPRFAHSLELGVLAQTGLVGALLLAGALGALLWPALAAVGRGAPEVAAPAGAATAVFVYWLAHGSVDWFFELPALTGPAIAFLGMAAAMRPDASAARTSLPRGIALAGLITAVGVALALAVPWLAEREITRAADTWREDVDAAQTALDRAAVLNPLSVRPAVTAGSIAVAVDDFPRAEEEFRKALEREPGNSYAQLELGLIASARGDRKGSILLLRRAAQLSPRDSLIAAALRRARRGSRLDPAAVNRRILQRARARESDAQ